MEVRQLRSAEVHNYLSNNYSYLKIDNPQEFTAAELKRHTTEDLQEVANMFTIAVSNAEFVAGICVYKDKFLQDGWVDENLSGFGMVLDSLMSRTSALATHLNSFKPSQQSRIEGLLASKG